jgi:hypothetical protein
MAESGRDPPIQADPKEPMGNFRPHERELFATEVRPSPSTGLSIRPEFGTAHPHGGEGVGAQTWRRVCRHRRTRPEQRSTDRVAIQKGTLSRVSQTSSSVEPAAALGLNHPPRLGVGKSTRSPRAGSCFWVTVFRRGYRLGDQIGPDAQGDQCVDGSVYVVLVKAELHNRLDRSELRHLLFRHHLNLLLRVGRLVRCVFACRPKTGLPFQPPAFHGNRRARFVTITPRGAVMETGHIHKASIPRRAGYRSAAPDPSGGGNNPIRVPM